MDGVWVEKQRFDILLMGRKQFKLAYEIDVNSPKFGYSNIPGQRYLSRKVRAACGREILILSALVAVLFSVFGGRGGGRCKFCVTFEFGMLSVLCSQVTRSYI